MFNLSDMSDTRSGGFMQVAAVTISALASFQFFSSHSGAFLAGLLPDEFLAIAAGLIGVVMLEGAELEICLSKIGREVDDWNSLFSVPLRDEKEFS